MKLYKEHLEPTETGFMNIRQADMVSHDYRPQVEDTRIAPSESTDHCYKVQKISVLDESFSPAMDVAEARIEMYLCSCDDFYYNQSNGLENKDRKPSEVDKCKHIISEYRTERAEQDPAQDTLDKNSSPREVFDR